MATSLQNPLRALTEDEQTLLEETARTTSERSDVRQRACALLLVAQGVNASEAARRTGYKSGEGVKQLVLRFNARGVDALHIAPGRGCKATYQAAECQQVLATLLQSPDRQDDGSGTWSLLLLERHLRREGLPHIGRETIRQILHRNGRSYQRSRTWCPTGTAKRKRKSGVVQVLDPQAEKKRAPLKQPISMAKR